MTAEESAGAVAHSAPPNDEQAVVDDIARTREQLGETVEALAAKADMKARAQEKVAEVSGRLKDKAQDVRDQVTSHADQARSGLADTTADARQKIAGASAPVASGVRDQVSSRAAQAGTAVFSAAPEPVQQTAKKAAGKISENPVPFAVAAGSALLVGVLIYRWMRR
jgi:ABC-type transporter Mla subunit MlaD